MELSRCALIAPLCSLLLTVAGGCSSSSPAQQWYEVNTFTGAGETKIPPFTIDDRHWRIDWKTARRGSDRGPALFCLNVLNDKGASVQSVYSKHAPEEGVLALRGPGTFQLHVSGAVRFTVKVETQH